MKKLQPLLSTAFLAVLFFATTLFISCNPNCRDTVCKNGGVCKMEADGLGSWGSHPACTCAAGFEGEDCGTASRDKLLGNYSMHGTDNNGGTYSSLNTSVTASATGLTKVIVDVSGLFTLTCTMSASLTLKIDPVTIAGYTYSGHADWISNELTLSVTKTDGNNIIVYSIGGSRQ